MIFFSACICIYVYSIIKRMHILDLFEIDLKFRPVYISL